MAVSAATGGFTVDDLDWLRDQVGFAHLELDPWGSLLLTPATDEHEIIVARLNAQLQRQIAEPDGRVFVNGFAWTVPGASGYLMVPDLAVLAPGWTRVGELHVSPPPLLVVEVASPSTRGVDRGRKLADYRLGGAGVYLRVDPPATFETYDFTGDRILTGEGSIDLVVGGQPVRFEL